MASNQHFSGTGGFEGDLDFGRAIGHILVNVTSATITLSFDQGSNAITLPTGFHSFPVGPTTLVRVGGTGSWEIVGIQAAGQVVLFDYQGILPETG